MRFGITYLLILYCFTCCHGQKPFGTEFLKLEKEIPMPEVKGRIDHMAINLKENILYVAALGNNSVEVIDLKNGSVLKSIKGLDEPQGVAYIPEANELVVANGGNSDCNFYNATNFNLLSSLHLPGDADNIRYNSLTGKIYVGYGNGGIAEINIKDHSLARQIKLDGHPESFQLDQKNDRIFVNVPDANTIAVIQLSSLKLLDIWKIKNDRANFPMSVDTSTNSVIVGYRRPATLVRYDAKTGSEVNRTDLVSDVDDVFYNNSTKQIIASGGGGAINIFKYDNSGFKQITNIPTRDGARTSLLVSSLQTFILAERASGGKSATIAVYKISN